MLTVLTPLLGVAVVGVAFVRRGNRRAFWAGLGLKRPGFRWWPVALGIPVVVTVLAYVVALAVRVAELPSPASAAGWIRAEGIDLLINATIGAVFILGEEIGWRGFLLPGMHTLLPHRGAWVVTGLAHGLFHLPLILLTTSSLWPVAIAHNAINVCFETAAKTIIAVSPAGLAYVAGEGGWATMCATWLVAGIVLTANAPGRSAGPPEERTTPCSQQRSRPHLVTSVVTRTGVD